MTDMDRCDCPTHQDAYRKGCEDGRAAVAARIEALCVEAEHGEGIIITPGFSTYHVIEVGYLRSALGREVGE